MKCQYQCYEVGGPWIAENPDCPVHGHEAQAEQNARQWEKERLYQQIHEAENIEDLKWILYDIVEKL